MASQLKLLCADGIFGLYRYTSMFSARANGRTDIAAEAQHVYNFKKHGTRAHEIEAMIRAVAEHFGCGDIIAVPGHTTAASRLQMMFGAKLRRTADVQSRKYNHRAEIEYRAQAATLAFDPVDAKHLLVVDDICTTGKTLNFYARYFRCRRKQTTLLCIGLNHKMKPVETDHCVEWEIAGEDRQQGEDAPFEDVGRFLDRMNRDFDLTKI